MFIPFKDIKTVPYAAHEDIPPLIQEYILYVAGEKKVQDIPLEDINDFLLMLYEREKKAREEWDDGWVL